MKSIKPRFFQYKFFFTTEIALSGFWEYLLGHRNFGVNDDFFLTGGNSIKAIQLLSRISSQFSVQLEISDIFLKPTITELAILINDKQKNNTVEPLTPLVEKLERGSVIPLSFSQERLFFID